MRSKLQFSKNKNSEKMLNRFLQRSLSFSINKIESQFNNKSELSSSEVFLLLLTAEIWLILWAEVARFWLRWEGGFFFFGATKGRRNG